MSRVQKNVNVIVVAVSLTFIAWYLLGNASFALSLSIFFMPIFLIAWAITSYFAHRQHEKVTQGKIKAGEADSLAQSRRIEIDLPFADAYDLALSALESLDGLERKSALPSHYVLKSYATDESIGRIKAGIRTKTFGITDPFDSSKIEIQIQRLDENASRLLIESQSALPNEIYDMGRNLHFVNHLAVFIRQAAEAESRLSDAEGELESFEDEQGFQRGKN